VEKFKLAFGLHNHQPVGNFEFVFEEAHQRAYAPFLKLLSQYKGIRLSLHQSGILWDWQQHHHGEYLETVKEMAARGQIDILTGGFYEPILTAIPERDAKGQIAQLTQYVRDQFDIYPEGLWLTERIWEPHLPKLLAQAKVKYLPIDDTHFLYAGMEQSQLSGPFVTEHEGHSVTLLPIQKRLRYLIPFGKVEEVIAELRKQADRNPTGIAVYADDGEKFGVWPKTYEHCYEDKWLENLFEAFAKNSNWLEVVPLGEAYHQKPVGRTYIPSASYAEMLHWSLPAKAFVEYEDFENWLTEAGVADKYSRFVRGGHWRGFLFKYEEANLMHKMALAVSEKIEAFERDNPDRLRDAGPARDRLYAGQCNCPYWHGVFGGLYLPHIRQAVWKALLEADRLIDELGAPKPFTLTEHDFDFDGFQEVIATDENYTATFKPSRGGSLLQLCLRQHDFNITDTLTRRKEGYHLKLDQAVLDGQPSETASIHDLVLTKEEGLKDLLVDDWYLKRCFLDHFFTADVDLAKFVTGKFGEEGDFVLEPYDHSVNTEAKEVTFTREGHLWRSEGIIPVRVSKKFRFAEDRQIRVEYELSTSHSQPVWVRFAVENNFNFQAGHAEDRFILVDNHRPENSYLDSIGEFAQSGSHAVFDQYRSLALAIGNSPAATLWQLPINTVSLSESGFEKVYQGTTFISLFELELTENPTRIEFALYGGSSETIPDSILSGAEVNSI